MAETRSLRAHEQLIYDVIQRQAGTLGKAILEAVQNSADARATECKIRISPAQVVVEDNGRGFRNREEITTLFEIFGQPSMEGDDRIYGAFRAGRGQLMSFGKNTWRSGSFALAVDIKTAGLKYILKTMKAIKPGCKIVLDLYKPMESLVARDDAEREVRKYCKYMTATGLSVFLNGELISQDPKNEKWDHESEFCFLRTTSQGNLAIYNLGAYVQEKWSGAYGLGGTVVSKVPMKMNFARNEVMSDCPVWTDVRKFLDQVSGVELRKKRSLNDGERQRLSDQFRLGQLSVKEARTLKLFADVNGRYWSAKQILRHSRAFKNRYTSCEGGDRRGCRVYDHHLAFVFSEATVQRFEASDAKALWRAISSKVCSGSYERPCWDRWQHVRFDQLTDGLRDDYDTLLSSEWTPRELIVIQAATTAQRKMAEALQCLPRELLIGTSAVADGWTDGLSYIALQRNWLRAIDEGTLAGAHDIGCLLLHEYCHDESDMTGHVHSPEFYQKFHDSIHGLSDFTHVFLGRLPGICEAMGKRVARKLMLEHDKLTRAVRATEAISACAPAETEVKPRPKQRKQKTTRSER